MKNTKLSIKIPLLLLFMFEVLAIFLLNVYVRAEFNRENIYAAAGVLVLVFLLNIIIIKTDDNIDRYLPLTVSMLFSVGLLEIFRLNQEEGLKQTIWIAVGILLFYVSFFVFKSIKFDGIYWIPLIISAIYFLFLLTLVFGVTKYGARNWIRIYKFKLQPGEITKILYIMLIACYYSNKKKYAKIKYSSEILTAILYSFIALFFLQKDLGSAVILYGVMMFSQFVFEEKRYLKYLNLITGVALSVIGYKLFAHVRIRIEAFIDPWKYIDGIGLQVTQSLFAISYGGFIGTGIGLGYPKSIPVASSDFIFSAICEEMGTLVGISVIMLFILLIYRAYKISLYAKKLFEKVLSFNVATLLSIQSILILGGVLKLIPLTGVTLPFVAYGGTSILCSFILLAMLEVCALKGDVDG